MQFIRKLKSLWNGLLDDKEDPQLTENEMNAIDSESTIDLHESSLWDQSPVSKALYEEARRRHNFFNVKFKSYLKIEDSGVLCLKKNKDWDLKKIVWANSLNHGDYMDARINSANGICKGATFEEVRQNLRKDMKLADLKMTDAKMIKSFQMHRKSAIENEPTFTCSLACLLAKLLNFNLNGNNPLFQKFFLGAGFISRLTDPGLPIPVSCDLVIPTAERATGKYTATVEFKLLREGSSLKIEDHDCWSAQTWSAGIGANVDRFMAVSQYGFVIYIRTLDYSYVPQSPSDPQKRYQYAKYPPGNEMASFDDFENVKRFFEIWHAFSQLSCPIDSDLVTSSNRPKRKMNSPCVTSAKRYKPQKRNGQQETETWLAACAEGPDMVMSSIDFKSLGKPVQKALKKIVKIKRFGEIDKWGEYQSSLRDERLGSD